MSLKASRQRLYAILLTMAAAILIYRATAMLLEGALAVLVPWVSALLILELAIDLACAGSALYWWKRNNRQSSVLPLRLAAAAAFLHAFRVMIFVIGRIGPWIDFDVRPEHRAIHDIRWTWTGVYFAAALSLIGIMAVIMIWRFLNQRKREVESGL